MVSQDHMSKWKGKRVLSRLGFPNDSLETLVKKSEIQSFLPGIHSLFKGMNELKDYMNELGIRESAAAALANLGVPDCSEVFYEMIDNLHIPQGYVDAAPKADWDPKETVFLAHPELEKLSRFVLSRRNPDERKRIFLPVLYSVLVGWEQLLRIINEYAVGSKYLGHHTARVEVGHHFGGSIYGNKYVPNFERFAPVLTDRIRDIRFAPLVQEYIKERYPDRERGVARIGDWIEAQYRCECIRMLQFFSYGKKLKPTDLLLQGIELKANDQSLDYGVMRSIPYVRDMVTLPLAKLSRMANGYKRDADKLFIGAMKCFS